MNAMRNLLHGAVLALWAVMGVVFTLKCLFGGPILPGMFTAGSFWLWFAGLAAITTLLVRLFEKAAAALLVHAGVFLFLCALPHLFPLSVFRLGIDLLSGRAA